MPANQYWRKKDQEDVKKAKTYSQLVKIAFRILKRMPQPIGQVCGPITSGGFGSLKKNLKVFQSVIDRLQKEGKTIFDQLPFENALHRLYRSSGHKDPGKQLLEEFYFPIFVSGLVKHLYFMPNWATSNGATWEFHTANHLGIPLEVLALDYLTKPK
ncbi:MAG: hypothetical protein AAB646_01390 [Patescibacteria group bacterium]